MRRLLRFIAPYWAESVLALLFMLGLTVADLAVPRLVQRIIDQGVGRLDLPLIRETAILMLGASLASAGFAIGNNHWSVRVAHFFSADLRAALYAKIQSLTFRNLDELQTGRLIVRLTSDIANLEQICLMSLRIAARAPLMLVGSTVLLVLTSRELAALMLVLLPATMGLIWIIIRKGRPLFEQVQARLDRLNAVLQESLAGVRVVKAFARAEYENRRFGLASRDLSSKAIEASQLVAVLMPTLSLILNLGTVAAVWLAGREVSLGRLTVGQVVAFVNYLLSTMFPLLLLGMIVGLVSAAQVSAERINAVLETEPDVQDAPGACSLSNVAGRVAFDNVTFSYRGDASEPVLQDISLVAEPGERIVILGATGSGKSSLVHLIPRFYEVTAGRVTIDGLDVRDVTQASLCGHIGVALQETVLFSGTIRDNIRYAQPEASGEEVVSAAQLAEAHEFITGFPDGYDSLVGQRGVTLSGGQKQRIAIARALLTRPPVLILDDATSSVDVDTEARIEKNLELSVYRPTSFVIAQRVSTALTADRIVVLERGHIIACGTHHELLQGSRIYREIYDSQLGGEEPVHD